MDRNFQELTVNQQYERNGIKEILFLSLGGQGALVAANILAVAAVMEDKHIYVDVNLRGERRMTPVKNCLRIADNPPVPTCSDYSPTEVIVFDEALFMDDEERIKKSILSTKSGILMICTDKDPESVVLPPNFTGDVATADCSRICLETVGISPPPFGVTALGLYAAATKNVSLELLEKVINQKFTSDIARRNIEALRRAYFETKISSSSKVKRPIEKEKLITNLISENEATENYLKDVYLWREHTPSRSEKKMAPCAFSCPLKGEIPNWLDKVKNGDWQSAWEILQRVNPFPAITGHICYGYCQEKCNRNYIDEKISIQSIEKAVGLWGLSYLDKPVQKTGGKAVAIIGSGPAGLSCAYYLREKGYKVTIFERSTEAGGLLNIIPEYRIPKWIVKKEIERLEDSGVEIKTGFAIAEPEAFNELRREFDAIFIAIGAQQEKTLNIPGIDLKGVIPALEFLKENHKGDLSDKSPVIIIGGGNVAIDAARVAKRRGASDVTVVYRGGREQMSASDREVEDAGSEGIKFIFEKIPVMVEGDGIIEGVWLAPSEVSERFELVGQLHEQSCRFQCSTLIMAIGREVDLGLLSESKYLKVEGRLKTEKGGRVSGSEGIFAGGDVLSGSATVTQAILGGREAAVYIDSYLKGESTVELITVEEPQVVNWEEIQVKGKEFHWADPIKESGRCLSCGRCSSCGTCWISCPDGAVEEIKGEYKFNLDYCKGCGICVNECPNSCLEMVNSK